MAAKISTHLDRFRFHAVGHEVSAPNPGYDADRWRGWAGQKTWVDAHFSSRTSRFDRTLLPGGSVIQ
jgi:hypothetical protein